VTPGAQPQTGNDATPDSEALRLKKAQETRERIEELNARAKAGIEYGEFWRQRFEEQQRQPAQAAAPPPAQEPVEPEPDPEAFEDPKAYNKALAAWSRKENERLVKQAEERAEARAKAAAEKAFTEQQQKQRAKALDDQFAVRHQDFAQKTPDYLVTISNPALTFMHGEFLEAIKDSEKGPEIAYHIAKNPQLVARLAAKDVPQRLRELGRIEAELSRPAPPPKVTTAPPPPAPIGGGSAGGDIDPSKMTVTDWMAWRSKQLREKRQAR
jgi:hypothetical protein